MRLLTGMILGAFFTIAGVYLYDSASTSSVAAGPSATRNTTIVNWDVAAADWQIFKERTRESWTKLSAR